MPDRAALLYWTNIVRKIVLTNKTRWKRLFAALILIAAMCLTPDGLPSARAEAVDITDKCRVKVSEGSRSPLLDNVVKTAWTYSRAEASIEITVPVASMGGTLVVEWMFEPEGYILTEYDTDHVVRRERTQDDAFPCIVSCFDLLPTARTLRLTMTAAKQEVCSVKVYAPGELPWRVQRWSPPVEKADLMVVTAHEDDELIYFGGTIPYYAVAQARPTVVVYMANCNRRRRKEALDGLWEMGVRDYPEFINLHDRHDKTVKEAIKLWGGKENILRELVLRIRRYRPEVIVTHDVKGEYGHPQHKVTGAAMSYAIAAAADPAQFPESYALYGAWQVKKLYLHLSDENPIRMNWNVPLDTLGGLTALEMAQRGYARHTSQQKYYSVVDGGKYDNARFGLVVSTVGADETGEDMFEHLSAPPLTPVAVEAPAQAGAEGEEEDTEASAAEDEEMLSGEDAAMASDPIGDDSAVQSDLTGDGHGVQSAIDDDGNGVQSAIDDDGNGVQSAFDEDTIAVQSALGSDAAARPPRRKSPIGWLIAALIIAAAAGIFFLQRQNRRRHSRRRRRR